LVVTERDPTRLLEDAAEDDALRLDLQRAAKHDVGYDVAAGLVVFEASLAQTPATSGAEAAGATSTGMGVTTKWALAIVGAAGLVAGGVAVSSGGEPAPAVATVDRDAPERERSTADTPAAAPQTDPDPDPEAEGTTGHVMPTPIEATMPPTDDAGGPIVTTPDDASEALVPEPPAATPRTKPAKPTPAASMKAELDATDAARRALASDPTKALSLARKADAAFPRGVFGEQRQGIATLAMLALGKSNATSEAEAYLRKYPQGTYADRVREVLSEKP
jgi:hypothetical protein